MYRSGCGWAGGGVSAWEAGGGLKSPLRLFGLAIGPRSSSHRPKHAWMALIDVSLSLGWISHSCLPCSTLHGSHCLSPEITGSAKLALESRSVNQAREWNCVCVVYKCSHYLAGPIKWNRSSATIRLVFENPVTYILCNLEIMYIYIIRYSWVSLYSYMCS